MATIDLTLSDDEAQRPPARRKKRDVLDSSDDDEEAAATARAAANLKRALAKPQDLTLSSDDEQQPKKKPKTAEPAEPENVVSRQTVEAAIAAAAKWRGAHTRIAGGDDVDEDEDVAKARRLMRTTPVSYTHLTLPTTPYV